MRPLLFATYAMSCGGLDPLHNVGVPQQTAGLQELNDLHQSLLNDGIGDGSAEKGGLVLSALLEVLGPLAARSGERKVCVRR